MGPRLVEFLHHCAVPMEVLATCVVAIGYNVVMHRAMRHPRFAFLGHLKVLLVFAVAGVAGEMQWTKLNCVGAVMVVCGGLACTVFVPKQECKLPDVYRGVGKLLVISAVVVYTAFVQLSADALARFSLVQDAPFKVGVDPCRNLVVDDALGTPHASAELVLVTGGSGFIGSHLVEDLLELGYTVRVFDNLVTGNLLFLDLRHPRLQFFFGDIMNVTALREAMVDVKGVFHLGAASKVLPSLKNPAMGTFNIERNAVGTSRVLEVANDTAVRKVVYAASSTYYGNQPVPFTETDPFMPTSPYAASKYMGELAMWTNDGLYGLHTLSLRFFMVYGPRNPSHGAYAVVTGLFLERKKRGLDLLIEGSGDHFRDFIHVKDIARGLILGYQSPVHATSINLGSGVAHTVQEVADLVSPNQTHVAARKNDLVGSLADTCRAKNRLHFRPRYEFVSVMREMIAAAEAGAGEYLASMWQDQVVADAFGRALPGWKLLSSMNQSQELRQQLERNPRFVSEVLATIL